MIGIPNFDVTNQSGKQKFVDYIVGLTRNEIISFTSSYNDNDNAASSGVLPSGLVPAGTIVMYGGTVLPDGYLWCDGSQQLIASYVALFVALGVSRYGVDTATQFYLPNLTSHLARGAATTGGVVTTNNNNAHTHSMNAYGASFTGTLGNTSTDGAHNHALNGANTGNGSANHTHAYGTTTTGGSATNRGATGTQASVANGAHQHSLSGNTGGDGAAHTHGVNAGGTNNDGNHNHSYTPSGNVPVTQGTAIDATYVPAFVEVNYIIKT